MSKKLTRTQELLQMAIGLIGTLFFGGFLVYGAMTGRVNPLRLIPLFAVLILLSIKPIRLRFKAFGEKYTPDFFYEHFNLIMLTSFIIGFLVMARLKSG